MITLSKLIFTKNSENFGAAVIKTSAITLLESDTCSTNIHIYIFYPLQNEENTDAAATHFLLIEMWIKTTTTTTTTTTK